MIEGLAYRLEEEITKLAPAGTQIRVRAPTDRNNNVW
jgi:actin-related protein